MNYAAATPSHAHTIGNITSYATEFVKDLFPKDYFTTVNITSKIGFRHFDIMNTANKNFIKKRKPILVVRPRLDIDNMDSFMANTYFTTRIADLDSIDGSNLQPFFNDIRTKRSMRYLLNRTRVYFDFTIILETQMEQINQVHHLRNRIRQNRPFELEALLESHVPRQLIQAVALDAEIDMDDTHSLLRYLNEHSKFPVSYKLKNSSGTDEFFRFHPCKIDTELQNLSFDEGQKKGFTDDAYTITFTLSTEFFSTGLYFYFTPNDQTVQKYIPEANVSASTTVIPAFTTTVMFEKQPPAGWSLYTSPAYKISTTQGPDVLKFDSLLSEPLKKLIKNHVDKGIPVSTFLSYRVMKDAQELFEKDNQFSVDFAKLELTTNVTNTLSTYRFILYVNALYVNEMLTTELQLDKEK